MRYLVCAIALVIAAGTLALSVDLATKPDASAVQRVAAHAPVRQIPLAKTADNKTSDEAAPDKTSDAGRGDPQNQLTPVYPATPGKDMPEGVADNTAAIDTQKPAETASSSIGATTAPTGSSALANDREQPHAQLASATTGASNSCAIDACSSAYRSFRAADCTYQPYGGPRKLCELPGGLQNASAASSSMPPRERMRVRLQDRAGDRDSDIRVVRQLRDRDNFAPDDLAPDYFADDRGRRVIVIEQSGRRYIPGVIYREP